MRMLNIHFFRRLVYVIPEIVLILSEKGNLKGESRKSNLLNEDVSLCSTLYWDFKAKTNKIQTKLIPSVNVTYDWVPNTMWIIVTITILKKMGNLVSIFGSFKRWFLAQLWNSKRCVIMIDYIVLKTNLR